MPTVENSVLRIRGFLKRPKWNRFRMAREARLSPNCLRDVLKDDWNPTLDTVRAIEAVIDAYERDEAGAEAGPVTTE